MFQTVPDTSSYVKVRHDSVFKQVITPAPLPPRPVVPPSPFLGQRVDLETGESLVEETGPRAGTVWETGSG